MRTKVVAGALSVALFASSAWAQSPPPPPADMPGPTMGGMAPPPPPGGMMREGRGPSGGMRHGPRDGRDGPPPPPPSKAAEFRFKRGPLEIRIRCAEEEPIKPCADAALTLMDKFGAVAGAMGDTPPAPPMGAPPPPAPPSGNAPEAAQ